jgi:hypothetical protein
MTLKTIQSTALSILLHCVFIFGLVSFTLSHQKPKQELKKQPIKSYLFFESPPAASEPVNKTADMEDQVVVQQARNKEKSAQPTNPEEIKLEIDPVAKSSSGEKKTAPPDTTESLPSLKLQTVVSQYFQNLDSKELDKLSENSLDEFRKPKPLIDKSIPLSTNQRLKALSSSFASKNSDIIVLSEFGLDETTIMLGDSCFTITQTALDDKVWKGSSRWTGSNSCGKYDKYDGQLQKSLNKYLQK